MLQEVPLVLSAVVIVCGALDFAGVGYQKSLCPLFGFSLYILARLYLVARRLYVSIWSRILYVALMAVSLTDLLDSLFDFSYRFVELQQHAYSLFLIAVLSSLLTYIYGKFKKGN